MYFVAFGKEIKGKNGRYCLAVLFDNHYCYANAMQMRS